MKNRTRNRHPASATPPLPILVTAVLLAGCDPAGAPDARDVPTYTIEQFMETVTICCASFSPDGEKLLFTSDASGVFNAYEVPVSGGEPAQLTHSTDALRTHGYFPADERFLYSSDQGGNELSHIYVRNPDGTTRDLTPGENVRAVFRGWADDEQSFFLATNERAPRSMDLYEMTLDGYERTLLYRNDRALRIGAISPDRRFLALARINSNPDVDLLLYDRETQRYTDLSPAEGDVWQMPRTFSPDGRTLYYLTDEGSEFRYLARYDLATGEHTTMLQPRWDVMGARVSPTGRYLLVAINNDARTELRIFERETMQPVPLPSIPDGQLRPIAVSRDDRHLALRTSSGRSPGDIYVVDIRGGDARPLLRTLSPAIDPEHLVEPEVVRFISFDGVEIPGLLYRPHGASRDTRVPAMIWIHGGPTGQSRVGYDPLIQYLLNHGYAVYAINNRGSRGYGKSFERMNDGKTGEADLGDVVASKRMLIETGWIDPERIGVMGASYGGYLTMAALTFRPEVFAGGVDLFGPVNWIRTIENFPPYWDNLEAWYEQMGHPEADRERLRRISPLFHADQITKPFLVLHGANDPRVLQIESDEMVAAARANGVPVEYIVFPDEGHGFRKKENQVRGYRAILSFLDRHLKGMQ